MIALSRKPRRVDTSGAAKRRETARKLLPIQSSQGEGIQYCDEINISKKTGEQ